METSENQDQPKTNPWEDIGIFIDYIIREILIYFSRFIDKCNKRTI